ncbi:Hypothetical protein CINCED_3A025235 [Cinara cedri]|uniref:Uncharacterized protein n=1 Tax=Cinara cedri TaxID=506608 RepID=A0A5E4MK83_9HEMI|nr:Hypothetical protein CINCED_3A025235 [Cinara cedri]
MAYVVWRVLRKKYLKVRSGLTLNGSMTVEKDGAADIGTADSADGARRNSAGPTTAVGHLYRQFSRRNKNKKNKQPRRESAPVQPTSLSPPPPPPSPTRDTRDAARIAATADLLSRVRPAPVGDIAPAPPWLVADHFFSEHVAHEHVSVAQEPDHADPVMDDGSGAPPPVRTPPLPPPPAFADATVDCSVPARLSSENEPGPKNFTVQQLVDELIGPYYVNYGETRAVLMRQAKQLLVGAYQADIVNFHTLFCVPASEILKKVVENFSQNQCCESCAGWPLSHGRRGVLTHLVAPSPPPAGPSPSDAYLLLDVARAGLTLNWVGSGVRLRSRLSTDTVAMLTGDLQQLSATLKHLVAVVDRSVHRVPLDRIAYPCYGCQDRTCQSSPPPQTQTPHEQKATPTPRHQQSDAVTPTLIADRQPDDVTAARRHDNVEDAGGGSVYDDADNSIPHIDSDPEDSAQDRHQRGSAMDNDDMTSVIHHQQKQQQSVRVPKSIGDLSEDVLTSGIQFPGAVDREGNAVILWVEGQQQSARRPDPISKIDAAELILYYASLRNRNERNSSLTVLVHENSRTSIEFVDRVLILIKVRDAIFNRNL